MKISKRIIAACCFILFAFTNLYAQKARIFGAQITYSKIDSNTFDVRYKLVLSSEDTSFTAGQISCYVNCPAFAGSRIVLPAPGLVSAKKEFPSGYCPTAKKLNQYEFSSIINLNDPFFANVKNCCELRFEIEACCRDSLINVFTGENMFLFAEANNCGTLINKRTTAFTTDLENSACCNQPHYMMMGALDTSEFDSLSFSFEIPLLNKNEDTVVYSSGFMAKLPLSVYYLSPLKYPYVNVNANPPMGLFFDPENGDMIFTPVSCNQVTSIRFKINEWRKNSSGIYQKIGVVSQEKRLAIPQCPGNYPPEITNTDFTFRTCAGERVCFDVTTDDKVFISPPPLPIPPPDKVRLTWNRGIPGAMFTITNKDSLHETARFCWTPGKADGNDLPYTFIATATDNFCPLNARTLRSFRVFVKHPAIADRKFTRLSDGRVLVEAVWTGRGTPDGYLWTVMDQNGTVITDNSLARFTSSDSFWSARMTDTLYLKNSGTYNFSFLVNNLPNNCPETYADTYIFHSLGVDHLKKSDKIILYPNPCRDNLTIETSGLNLLFYKVVDVSGRVLFDGKFESKEMQLDVGSLQPGIYNLILSDGTDQYQNRFLKIPEY